MQIQEYLGKVLDNAGFAGIEMQKNPLGMRITIKTARPGTVIGKKGVKIRELSDAIATKFGIENPQIDVETLEIPELNGQIMAEAIAFGIKKGQNYRKAAYSVMRRVIKAGARGIEVKIGGKSTSQRAKTLSFRAGVISKCGAAAEEGVSKGVAIAILKTGVIGVRVRIMPLDYKLPDEILLRDASGIKVLKQPIGQIPAELSEGGDIVITKESNIIIEEDEEEESIFEVADEKKVSNIELEDLQKTPTEENTSETENPKQIEENSTKEETLGEIISSEEKDGKKEKKERKKREKKKKDDKE